MLNVKLTGKSSTTVIGLLIFFVPFFTYLSPANLKQLNKSDVLEILLSLIIILIVIFISSFSVEKLMKRFFNKKIILFPLLCFAFYLNFLYTPFSESVREFLFPKFASTYEGGGQGEPLPTSFTLQVRKKAGVPKKQILDNGIEAERTFHSFRHTTAFLMQRSNISEDDRREVLGHEDSAVHKIYMKPSSEAVARALKSSIPKELVAVS